MPGALKNVNLISFFLGKLRVTTQLCASLTLVGWKSQDATVACLPIDQLELHFRVEFK